MSLRMGLRQGHDPYNHIPQLDLFNGRRVRDEKVRRVTNEEDEDWKAAYRILAERFFERLPPLAAFTGEDLRVEALTVGIGEPHHANVWGAMAGAAIRGWLKTGRAVDGGYAQLQAVRSHARRTPRYVKVE
jgi:hypothetical protein